MRSLKATSAYVGVVFLFLSYQEAALAQAPVQSLSVPAAEVRQQNEQQQAATVELYLDIQTLRTEVTELRGMIEELNYEIQRLQSRQTADYENLDSRILQITSAGQGQNPSPVASSEIGSDPQQPDTLSLPVAPQIENESAGELYSQGLASLRTGDTSGALSTFGDLISQYPTDPVAADAYYWVGESHWVALEYEQAREAYAGLVNNFPSHRRYGDALYKLSRVYLNLGDRDQAIVLLQEAQQLGGEISARASELLEEISQNQL